MSNGWIAPHLLRFVGFPQSREHLPLLGELTSLEASLHYTAPIAKSMGHDSAGQIVRGGSHYRQENGKGCCRCDHPNERCKKEPPEEEFLYKARVDHQVAAV